MIEKLTAFRLWFDALTTPGKYFWAIVAAGALVILVTITKSILKLRGSPRELWLLYGFKLAEYTAFGAMGTSMMMLWLESDCGMDPQSARTLYSVVYSSLASVVAILAGSVVDTAGMRRVCLISVSLLLYTRAFLSFVTDPWLAFSLGLIPMALGFGIVAPVVAVGIKRFTTRDTAAVGFGLFYVIMNLGYAIGGGILDWIRGRFNVIEAEKLVREKSGYDLLGHHFTTYQMVFIFAFCATLVSALLMVPLRDGVERTPDGGVTVTPFRRRGSIWNSFRETAADTGKLMAAVARERFFWVFLSVVGVTVFVRCVFLHLNTFTFPTYAIRVFGEKAKIGSLYGVLNPVLVLFLVPLVAMLTKKVASFGMFLVGATISAASCFLVLLPAERFEWLTGSALGEMIFVHWLHMAGSMEELLAAPPPAYYWPLILFIAVFTVGEAIWSPRLMQFTAEIAPKGKESTYLSLAILPFFLAKLLVGPLSGWLLAAYAPMDANGRVLEGYNHAMIWVWVGIMALVTPIGLLICQRFLPKGDHGGSKT